MCGRYSLFAPPEDLEERFDAVFRTSFSPTYNAAPGQSLPVLTAEEPEAFSELRWGLVPSWADEDDGGHINARAETVAEKPTFRNSVERRRCLVPANGFYEWAESERTGAKTPYRITLENDEPFAMAGLWDRWKPSTTQVGLDAFGEESADTVGQTAVLESFAILTVEANDLVADVHDRMPVILSRNQEREWLDGTIDTVALESRDPDGMRAYPVSSAVNDPSNDDPSIVEPVAN